MHQPSLCPVPQHDKYYLLNDYPVKYGNIKITVPAMFIFDGASIPWFAWLSTYTPFHPDVMGPAVVHDWLYLNHQTVRNVADEIFYDLLILNGANIVKSKLMYKAVKLAGKTYWKHDRQDYDKLLQLYILTRTRPNFKEYHFPLGAVDVAKNKDKQTHKAPN